MPEADDVRIAVLGPVRVVVNGMPVPLDDQPQLTSLLTLLALGPEKGVRPDQLVREIWAGKSLRNPANSLQRAVSRLRDIGLRSCLPSRPTDGRYRLVLPDERIDARRLLAAARSLEAGQELSDRELDEVLALWRGDPTADDRVGQAHGVPARKARRRLEDERRRRTRPRLLIVDDRVGPQIKSILGDYRCEVVTSLEEFWPIADQCEKLFDAALVDLHLGPGLDAQGEAVLDFLARTSVPAILMTYRPKPDVDPVSVVQRYNLLGYHVKASNQEDCDFSKLRELVKELLGGNITATLLSGLDEGLARRERKARKRIELTGQGPVATAAMQADVDRIRALIRRGGPLLDARQAVADFSARWLLEDR